MNKFQANICLLTATACWALEIILFKHFPPDVPAFAVVSLGTGLSAICLAVVFWPHLRVRPTRGLLWRAGLLAVLNVAQNTLAIIGTRKLDLSTSMFLLTLYVVGVPIVLTLGRRGVPGRTWAGVAVILVGLALAVPLRPGVAVLGSMLVLVLASTVRSFYVVGVNDAAKAVDPAQLAVYLLAAISVLAFLGWLITDPASITGMDYSPDFIATLFMYSIFAYTIFTAAAFFAQPYVSAANVAVVYSLLVVFSVALGATLPSLLVSRIALTSGLVAGCALICLGTIVAEVDVAATVRRRPRPRGRAESPAVLP